MAEAKTKAAPKGKAGRPRGGAVTPRTLYRHLLGDDKQAGALATYDVKETDTVAVLVERIREAALRDMGMA